MEKNTFIEQIEAKTNARPISFFTFDYTFNLIINPDKFKEEVSKSKTIEVCFTLFNKRKINSFIKCGNYAVGLNTYISDAHDNQIRVFSYNDEKSETEMTFYIKRKEKTTLHEVLVYTKYRLEDCEHLQHVEADELTYLYKIEESLANLLH